MLISCVKQGGEYNIMKGLYDSDGNVFDFKPNLLDRGSSAAVYKISDDVCLKKFYPWSLEHLVLRSDELQVIKKLKLSNIYEVYEFLYNSKNDFAGYTMKFYQKEIMDLFLVETSFILDNFTSIDKSIIELAKHNICLYDMHGSNAIINNNGITLIDVDDSHFDYSSSVDDIISINREQVSRILKDIFYESLKLFYRYDYVKLYDERVILELSRKYGIYGIDFLCKELEDYKYPIDYVKAKIKTI